MGEGVSRDAGEVVPLIAMCALGLTSCQIWTIRDNTQRQLRAYVSTNVISMKLDASNKPDVFVTMKNFGQTPAYIYSHWACLAVRDFTMENYRTGEPTPALPPNPIPTLPGKSMIGPGDVRHKWLVAFCDEPSKLDNRPLTNDERAALRLGTKVIYLYGEAAYTDAFGVPRYSRYRVFSNDSIGLAEGKTVDAQKGNEAN
jgi:hypothetical protein